MGRRDMASGRLGARHQYQTALVSFQLGNMPAGTQAFANVMRFQQTGSHWLFQIALADRLYTSGLVSERICSELFDNVLREPKADR